MASLAGAYPFTELQHSDARSGQLLVRDALVHDLGGPQAQATDVRVLQAPQLTPTTDDTVWRVKRGVT